MLGVLRFGDEAARLLGEMSSPPGTGIDNPIDAPEARARAAARTRLLLVLRSAGCLRGEERGAADRRKVQARGVPVFDELPDAAEALAAMRHHERFPHERR